MVDKRKVTDADIKRYHPMISKFLRDSVCRNWNESAVKSKEHDVTLGNTGMSLADFRQYLMMEVCVGLQKYNPDYRTKDGKSVKESTFIFTHLRNRIGQSLKRLTKKRFGYGAWISNLDELNTGNHDE